MPAIALAKAGHPELVSGSLSKGVIHLFVSKKVEPKTAELLLRSTTFIGSILLELITQLAARQVSNNELIGLKAERKISP